MQKNISVLRRPHQKHPIKKYDWTDRNNLVIIKIIIILSKVARCNHTYCIPIHITEALMHCAHAVPTRLVSPVDVTDSKGRTLRSWHIHCSLCLVIKSNLLADIPLRAVLHLHTIALVCNTPILLSRL